MQKKKRKSIQGPVEACLFWSRWLLAPFFFGLIASMISLLIPMTILLYRIFRKIIDFCGSELYASQAHPSPRFYDLLVPVLELVDVSLLATLLVIIAFSGYHSFVSKIDAIERDQAVDLPTWINSMGFDDLKLKLMGVMVVITGLELLKDAGLEKNAFSEEDYRILTWKVIIHLTFVASGVLFALTERIAGGRNDSAPPSR